MYTSELFEEIKSKIALSPSAEYELKKILKCLDGKTIDDDLEESE